MPLSVDIVTAERIVYSATDVSEIVAPGAEGEFAVLPQHAAFISTLAPGELRIMRAGGEEAMAITGGFFEVRDDRVVVLADAAERVEEIDIARAQAARERAETLLHERVDLMELAATQAALQRALVRLRVAERRGRRGRPGPPQPGG